MKAVLLSVQEKWCDLIVSGKKTIEVRKRIPKLEPPYKCYICKTKSGGQVICEFICDKRGEIGFTPYINHGEYVIDNGLNIDDTCVSFEEMYEYIGETFGHGLHISELKVYDKPQSIRDFYKICPEGHLESGKCKSFVGFTSCPLIGRTAERDKCGKYVELPQNVCMNYVKRPSQSWCYVEEI